MAPGNGVSWTPLHDLEGTITPNGLHFERHHNGVPEIDPKRHQLLIHGLVERPLMFSVDNLLRYPMRSLFCFIECGGNSNAGWRSKPIQTRAGYFHGMALQNASPLDASPHLPHAAKDGQAEAERQQDDADPYEADDGFLVSLHQDPVFRRHRHPVDRFRSGHLSPRRQSR